LCHRKKYAILYPAQQSAPRKELEMAKDSTSDLTMTDRLKLRLTRRPSDVHEVALEVIERIPGLFYLVVGPVTSRKDPEENMARINRIISQYKESGRPTFNHLPFLRRIVKILRRKLGKGPLPQDKNIILQKFIWRFYKVIIKTGRVSKILVMMNSTWSSNVRSIKKLAQEEGIPVRIIMKKKK
jgi:hypothetical protein